MLQTIYFMSFRPIMILLQTLNIDRKSKPLPQHSYVSRANNGIWLCKKLSKIDYLKFDTILKALTIYIYIPMD